MPTSSRARAKAAYALLALIDAGFAASGERGRRARRITKPLLMPLLSKAVGPVPKTITAAQALSWGGDVALLGHGRLPFLSGVASFAGAHGAYVVAFRAVADPDARLADSGTILPAAVWAVVAPVLANAAGEDDPALRGPVAVYAAILASMAATSTRIDRRLPGRSRVMSGTALFMLSDALIGVQRFLRDEPSPPLEAAIMLTYTAGQWCIADGMARLEG